MAQNQVVIHQRRPDGYVYYAGSIPTSVGSVDGVTLLPGRSWIDPEFDLSVRLGAVLDQDSAVEITVGPAAAVQAIVSLVFRGRLLTRNRKRDIPHCDEQFTMPEIR